MSRPFSGYRLYGVPHSLYTGIARCFLRTQGIEYTELPPGHPDFSGRIQPTIRRSIVPVLETPDGQIIQDSLDIIDFFEQQGVRYSAYPETSLQRVLAVIIQFYGTQTMLRHAMHFRWSVREQQETFLRDVFSAGLDEATTMKVMARMHSYLPNLGVTEQTIPQIEASYKELLAILNTHFAHHPYLLGGRPSIADYGLIGPMFAHLGRDPVPSHLMKVTAPKVFRWVERMTAPGLDLPDFADYGSDYVADDQIPDTLVPLLRHIAAEIFPELTDKMAFMDNLIRQLNPEDGDPVAEKAHQRYLGTVDTVYRGVPVRSGVEPYLFYVLRRADQALSAASPADQERVRHYLEEVGLLAALPGDRGYSVDRREHVEVWSR